MQTMILRWDYALAANRESLESVLGNRNTLTELQIFLDGEKTWCKEECDDKRDELDYLGVVAGFEK